jgi:hypothetical protein
MTVARAMCVGPGARRALIDGATGEVEVVLSRGAYVHLEPSDWLLLSGPGAPFGPLSLVVLGLEELYLRPGLRARVREGLLVLGEDAVSLERVRDRRAVGVGRSTADLTAIRSAAAAARSELPAPPAPLHDGIAALAAARPSDGVGLLAGLGEGLTPAGDDVLAGYAAARFALGAPVPLSPTAAGRSSALGLAYLRSAERGELPDVGADLLSAIVRGSVAAARAAVTPLRSWGATSGAALGWGIDAAAMQSTERSY